MTSVGAPAQTAICSTLPSKLPVLTRVAREGLEIWSPEAGVDSLATSAPLAGAFSFVFPVDFLEWTGPTVRKRTTATTKMGKVDDFI